MRESNASGTIAAVLALIVVSSQSAHAYIDPGTGSYVLQVVAAGVLAAAFVVKATWRNIRQSVGRMFGRKPKDE